MLSWKTSNIIQKLVFCNTISNDKQYAAKRYGNNFGADCSIIERAFKDLPAQTGMNYSLEAKEVRDKFREFFYSDDGNEAAWQETIANHDGYTDPRINYYRPSFLLHLLSKRNSSMIKCVVFLIFYSKFYNISLVYYSFEYTSLPYFTRVWNIIFFTMVYYCASILYSSPNAIKHIGYLLGFLTKKILLRFCWPNIYALQSKQINKMRWRQTILLQIKDNLDYLHTNTK